MSLAINNKFHYEWHTASVVWPLECHLAIWLFLYRLERKGVKDMKRVSWVSKLDKLFRKGSEWAHNTFDCTRPDLFVWFAHQTLPLSHILYHNSPSVSLVLVHSTGSSAQCGPTVFSFRVKVPLKTNSTVGELTHHSSTAMSKWLSDGEVLVGQGSGEVSSCSPRSRGPSAGGPVSSPVRARLTSPRARETMPHQETETMDKARELFVLCDKEGKGFITKRDMQVKSCWRNTIQMSWLYMVHFLCEKQLFLVVVSDWKESYHCPWISWRMFSTASTDRAMDSSRLWSLMPALVSYGRALTLTRCECLFTQGAVTRTVKWLGVRQSTQPSCRQLWAGCITLILFAVSVEPQLHK